MKNIFPLRFPLVKYFFEFFDGTILNSANANKVREDLMITCPPVDYLKFESLLLKYTAAGQQSEILTDKHGAITIFISRNQTEELEFRKVAALNDISFPFIFISK